jgi:bifunctional N-acetylglucosamine-1-phosphate-uridyltransferase/glucosamine-1-phosphate-acetyltransferase GlmU-like protein
MKGLIVAAGKNTRFGSEKALAKINGVENIVRTYNLMDQYMEQIYVAIRKERFDEYKKVLPNATIIKLDKSEGCGQAVKDAMKLIYHNDIFMITWGDMYFRDLEFLGKVFNDIDRKTFNILGEYRKNPKVGYDFGYFNEFGQEVVCLRGEKVDGCSSLVKGTNYYMDMVKDKRPDFGVDDRGVFFTTKDFILPWLEKLEPNSKGEYHLLDITKDLYTNNNPAKLLITNNTGIRTFNTTSDLERIIGDLNG